MSTIKPTTPADLPKIGAKLAKARQAKKLSQEAVGDALGKDRIAVSNWERDINLPEMASFYRLCKMLDISMDELLERHYATNTTNQTLTQAEPSPEYPLNAAKQNADEKIIRAQIAGLLSPLGMEISAWAADADEIEMKISTTGAPAEERRGMRVIEESKSDRNDRPFADQGFISKKAKKTTKTTARKGSQS